MGINGKDKIICSSYPDAPRRRPPDAGGSNPRANKGLGMDRRAPREGRSVVPAEFTVDVPRQKFRLYLGRVSEKNGSKPADHSASSSKRSSVSLWE